MNSIYLDNSLAARPSDKILSEMMPYFTELWGAPSQTHQMGERLIPAVKESWRAIYDLIGASERDTVVFTSSGAEAVNQAFASAYFDVVCPTGKNQFIASKTDEAPALMAISKLEQMGCVGKIADVDHAGRMTKEILGDVLTPRTAMVSLSWANGLTGVVQPVEEIASLCKDRGVLFHLDATHVLGKLYFDLEEVGADLISFNGSSIHAPNGTGGLFIKEGYNCTPFIVGGTDQGGFRAGSFSVPLLVGLGAASKEALDSRDLVCMEVARLRDIFEEELLGVVPEAVVFYKEEERLPNCTTIGFPGVANEALLFLLNSKGVLASIGGGKFQQIGLILEAAGVDEVLARSSVSFSLSRETTEEEILKAAAIIADSVKSLRKASKYIWKKMGAQDGI